MLALIMLSLVALASAETVYLAESLDGGFLQWEKNETWKDSAGRARGVPLPEDDVVFTRGSGCLGGSGWALLLSSDVTVKSFAIAGGTSGCGASFVVQEGAHLHAQSFAASSRAKV